MRTMMIANSLVTALNPTAKGALGLINPNGTACDFLVSPQSPSVEAPFVFVNSLGNGSIKNFQLNPYEFNVRSQLSGSATNVVPTYSITYPTGNARVDSFTNQFQGGIIVKKFDKDKNVFNTVDILNVEVIGAGTVVTAVEVKAVFKTAMATLIGVGKAFASVAHTAETSSIYTLNNTLYRIDLVGDLRHWVLTKINGSSLAVTGADAVKFERELAANSGYIMATEMDNPMYADSNFIADATETAYDIITIETQNTIGQRKLLPNSAGFVKTLDIYIPHSAKAAVYDVILAFLVKLKASPSVVGA